LQTYLVSIIYLANIEIFSEMPQLLLWRPLASALVAEGPTKREASASEDRKSNCCDIHTSQIFPPFLPGRELFCYLCPHLDVVDAPEYCQRPMTIPGVELLAHLCPYLDYRTTWITGNRQPAIC